MSRTLDGLLAERARAHPDRAALILPRGRGFATTTFGQLDARVDAVAAGLRHAGVLPGMRTALLVPPTADFFVLAFALLRLRAVPVLVDPGIGRDRVRSCLAEAAPEAFLGSAKAHLARRVLRWAPTARVLVTAGLGPPLGGTTLRRVERAGRWRQPFVPPERVAGSPAAVLISADEWESIQETLFWLSQPGIRESVAEADADLAAGRVLTEEQVRALFDVPRRPTR